MSRNESYKNGRTTDFALAALGSFAMYQMSKRRQAEFRATHDRLTGLFNIDGLEKMLTRTRPPRAILYVDSTNQKAVNDRLGHDRGDAAIIGAANILQTSLRKGDYAARVGGDEFLVILRAQRPSQLAHPPAPADVLAPVLDRIGTATQAFLAENPDLGNVGFDIAVGGTIWQEGMSIDSVRQAAEEAMYDAKNVQHQVGGQHRS